MSKIIIEFITTWMDWMTIIFAFLSMLFATWNFFSNKNHRKKLSEIIPIYFHVKNNYKYKLKLDIPRKNITRAEIQGLLSNFCENSKDRYNIAYMLDINYLENIYQIQDNKKDELIIKLKEEEFKLFDIKKIQKL